MAAADACRVLGQEDITAAFVYFGIPDVVAHGEGLTPRYTASITASDSRIGRVIESIRSRAAYATERWTYIVVTDHGHRDEGGHGGETDPERTAWIAASGNGVPATPPDSLEQADVHAHVLHALGIEADPSWQLTGRPFTR